MVSISSLFRKTRMSSIVRVGFILALGTLTYNTCALGQDRYSRRIDLPAVNPFFQLIQGIPCSQTCGSNNCTKTCTTGQTCVRSCDANGNAVCECQGK